MKTISRLIALLLFLFSCSIYTQEIGKEVVKKEFSNLEEALKSPEKVYKLLLDNQNLPLDKSALSKFVNLEYLSLKNDGLDKLPLEIISLKSLKILDISGNNFKELPEQISELQFLEELYLNDEKNLNIPKTLKTLSKMPNLKTLHLENDNLYAIPKELFSLKNLENIFLNDNHLKNLPKKIKTLDHLKYLDLKNNFQTPEIQEIKNMNFGFKINL
jgi:Leucine-rich repeat (LRR) protein